LPERETSDLCAAFQTTAFAHLDDRLCRAIGFLHDSRSPIRSLVVVGGVAANQALRTVLSDVRDRANEELSQRGGTGQQDMARWEVSLPPPGLCTDNGVMVAWAGVELFQAGISSDTEGDLQPLPRWPIGTPLSDQEKSRFRQRRKSFLTRRRP
jgi:N6-L-threonylcarbamoyladenine synthase